MAARVGAAVDDVLRTGERGQVGGRRGTGTRRVRAADQPGRRDEHERDRDDPEDQHGARPAVVSRRAGRPPAAAARKSHGSVQAVAEAAARRPVPQVLNGALTATVTHLPSRSTRTSPPRGPST